MLIWTLMHLLLICGVFVYLIGYGLFSYYRWGEGGVATSGFPRANCDELDAGERQDGCCTGKKKDGEKSLCARTAHPSLPLSLCLPPSLSL